jgi:amino acid transporter
MAPAEGPADGAVVDKGLKSNAMGLVTSTAVGLASTAPAYSLAATLGFVVIVVGVQTPLLVVLAFVPMFFSSWANSEMNRADPDCGTSFTWAARALGPTTGWFAGGWGTIAADLLSMASYAQIAGQYVFLLVGADSIGHNASSTWVLLVGIGWIFVLSYLCYRGIQVSARLQEVLIVIEVIILLVMSVWALAKVGNGTAPIGHIDPSWSWFDPLKIHSFNVFMQGMLLMIFIYWGWDTTVSLNEETEDPSRVPGLAGILSTVILLVTYLLVTLSVQSFAGTGNKGIGLGNPANQNDVLSGLGHAIFGGAGIGGVLSKLLIFMVLTSTAATAQTTILPNARTTLSMAFHKALPDSFARTHPVYKSPTVSTWVFAAASLVFYIATNYLSHGNVISDSVDAATFFIALYLGITGFACAWHYRRTMFSSARTTWNQGVMPFLSGVLLFFFLGWNIYIYCDPSQSYATWLLPFAPHWRLGGTLMVGVITTVAGLAVMAVMRIKSPAYFSGESMRSGLSITDDDDVVRIDPD